MSSGSPITVDCVPKWLHAHAEKTAKDAGSTLSAVVREALLTLVKNPVDAVSADFGDVPTTGTESLHLRLQPEDAMAIRAAGSAAGHNRSRWVVLALCKHWRS